MKTPQATSDSIASETITITKKRDKKPGAHVPTH
jgi:hypothetical protein